MRLELGYKEGSRIGSKSMKTNDIPALGLHAVVTHSMCSTTDSDELSLSWAVFDEELKPLFLHPLLNT